MEEMLHSEYGEIRHEYMKKTSIKTVDSSDISSSVPVLELEERELCCRKYILTHGLAQAHS